MKLVFKTETEILEEIDTSNFDPVVQRRIERLYNSKNCKKMEIIFKENFLVSQSSDVYNISDEHIDTLILTIEE